MAAFAITQAFAGLTLRGSSAGNVATSKPIAAKAHFGGVRALGKSAFAQRAKHVMPDKRYKPTPTHHFLKLLHGITRRRDDGTVRSILRRVYTQNIDTLEQQVGLPPREA